MLGALNLHGKQARVGVLALVVCWGMAEQCGAWIQNLIEADNLERGVLDCVAESAPWEGEVPQYAKPLRTANRPQYMEMEPLLEGYGDSRTGHDDSIDACCNEGDELSIFCSSSEAAVRGMPVADGSALDNSVEQPVQTVGWRRRNIVTSGPDRRLFDPKRTSALQKALLKFAKSNDGYVMEPSIGTEFDSTDEAFEFYNLYSWERDFGIRKGKCRY